MIETFWVYMLASRPGGALYIGITNNLSRRVAEHKSGEIKGFSQKYKTKTLVWYESFFRPDEAIAYEKRLKKWRRDWKNKLIEKMNKEWVDLYDTLNA